MSEVSEQLAEERADDNSGSVCLDPFFSWFAKSSRHTPSLLAVVIDGDDYEERDAVENPQSDPVRASAAAAVMETGEPIR